MIKKYKSKKCEELVNKIKECRANNDIETMKILTHELKAFAEDIQDTYSIAAALFYMSLISFIEGENDSTLSISMEILNICDLNNIPEYFVQALNMMGIVYASISDFITAIGYLLKAYYYALEHEELHYCYFPLNNIGALFQNLDIPDMALKYFLSSHEYKKRISHTIDSSDTIPVVNIIAAYTKLMEYDKARQWLELYDRDYRQFESPAAAIEIAIQRINLYKHDTDLESMKPYLEDLLNLSEGVLNKNRYFKLLLETLEICIEVELTDYAKRLLEKLESMSDDVHDILLRQHLSGLKVKMSIKKYPDDESYQMLYQYYLKNENYRELEKSNTRQSLQLKIEQEEMINEHRLVLLKNAKLLKNNELDAFTGVYNKTAFKRHVSKGYTEHAKDAYAALLMIDIDDFKNINDTFGHYVGDQVILDVVGILTKDNQSNVLIGRVGGDEFAVFIPSFYSLDYLYEKVNNYLKATTKITANDTMGLISLSIGIYLTKQNESYDEMFKKADHALYMAKRKGKNQFSIYAEPNGEEAQQIEVSLHSKSLEQFLPTIYKVLNTAEYSSNDLLTVLKLCLQALDLKQASLQIFNQEMIDQYLFIDLKQQPDHFIQSVKRKNIIHDQDKHYVVIDFRNTDTDYSLGFNKNYRACMQALIVFNQHPLGFVTFYDEQVHAWNEKELTILRVSKFSWGLDF